LTASTDSLASISSGSNRELKHQLDSTIAQVEAFAKEIERRKRSTVSLTPSLEAAANSAAKSPIAAEAPPEVKQHRSVSIGGARPRLPTQREEPVSAAPVVLRQSSWGSREQVLSVKGADSGSGSPSTTGSGPSFARSRNLWAKRAETDGSKTISSPKDFWHQKARTKQTPDLVLGLPVKRDQKAAAPASKGSPSASRGSSSSPKSESEPPVPKPRTLNTGSRPSPSSSAGSSPKEGEARTLGETASGATGQSRAALRPQVRVKPQARAQQQQAQDQHQTTTKDDQH